MNTASTPNLHRDIDRLLVLSAQPCNCKEERTRTFHSFVKCGPCRAVIAVQKLRDVLARTLETPALAA